MKTGDKGIALIKAFEGCRKRPYRCPAKLWTVGYGKLMYPDQAALKVPERLAYPLRPEHDREFTPGEIDAFLAEELHSTERGVARLCPGTVGDQGPFDALVSFAFNCGLGALQRSTVRAAFNRGDLEAAGEALMRYVKAAGKELPGLVRRRAAEKALLFTATSGSVV